MFNFFFYPDFVSPDLFKVQSRTLLLKFHLFVQCVKLFSYIYFELKSK